MDAYLEVVAIPNDEIREGAVVSSLMQNVHRLLPRYAGRIGLSFPMYRQNRMPGNSIRAHGSFRDIQSFYEDLVGHAGVTNYALVIEPQSSPTGSKIKGHHAFVRVLPKGASRLRRQEARYRQRGEWTPELEAQYRSIKAESLALPYFNLKSDTNGEKFLLFLDRKVFKESLAGKFGSYGVNSGTNSLVTVPWFE